MEPRGILAATIIEHPLCAKVKKSKRLFDPMVGAA
jgi:hypothetical protein